LSASLLTFREQLLPSLERLSDGSEWPVRHVAYTVTVSTYEPIQKRKIFSAVGIPAPGPLHIF